ncbi:lipid-A-disaccharide synthase [Thermomonas haemolytica]|uniref:Lipid-A-disaccharide synthase n=1 Tax=Thermomonas haemolytica TaxID=141949 RepID=A0A4V6P033_9GAMM|nr:lipid-A-disaccharide synthase [Thermomonas haemolytica]TCT26092.1 lipid-A-disaccharide synthase [Thermomonas haemolytica]TNY28627.1 lipid-A-disaccharide synthase [Thermomonas haemolytica]
MTVRIALCAGETSGDQLGADLVAALRERFPDAQFAGIGGEAMRAAGVDTWWDASELAVMGLAEVLAHLPRLLRLRQTFRQRVLAWQPDVFIGIDAPDFNLGVERWLKRRGVRTVHDVSPSVWAWREHRAAKIGASADRVLCLFPMEPPIYARHGIDAAFIGHPLADAIPLQPDRAGARAALGEPADAPILALLPGSRLGEIRRMLPDFAAAARLLAHDVPGLRVLVPAANAHCRAAIDALLRDAPLFRVIDGQAQRSMIASDVVLLASGTAALEAMLCKRPMVVGHRIAPLTYRIVKWLGLLKSRFVSLPNVLAGEALIPELLQDDCTPGRLHAALLHWFRDPGAVAALQPRFLALHETLRRDASRRAADAVAELLPR